MIDPILLMIIFFGIITSYTDFKYSNMVITPEAVPVNGDIKISVDVKNTGSCIGDEVVQLYVNGPQLDITRPVKELKGFKRITLEPARKKTVVFTISATQLGYYNREVKYVVAPGTVKVMIGSSSDDIRQSGEFRIDGKVTEIKDKRNFFTSVEVK